MKRTRARLAVIAVSATALVLVLGSIAEAARQWI